VDESRSCAGSERRRWKRMREVYTRPWRIRSTLAGTITSALPVPLAINLVHKYYYIF
jgi:hypothetical protein